MDLARERTGGGCFECGNKGLGFVKCGKFLIGFQKELCHLELLSYFVIQLAIQYDYKQNAYLS
jgi:hypothetical protein